YRPAAEIVPILALPPAMPLTLQVTVWSLESGVTVAENCRLPPKATMGVSGLTRRPGRMLNDGAAVNCPRGVLIMAGPVVAASGTSATISVLVAEITLALLPLKSTVLSDGPGPKPMPLKVTRSPATAITGVSENNSSASGP